VVQRITSYKDGLRITPAMLQECKEIIKKVCVAWIDCQRACDKCDLQQDNPVLKSLIGISNKMVCFTGSTVSDERINVCLCAEEKLIEREDIKYSGEYFKVFQYHHSYFHVSLVSLAEHLTRVKYTPCVMANNITYREDLHSYSQLCSE
jgi:hypothetical protein